MPVSDIYAKDTCIVLKRMLFNDTDAHLILLGKQLGKILVLAKGVGKKTSKLSSILDVGNLITVDLYEGKAGYTLISASQVSTGEQGERSYERLLTSVYLCELVDFALEEASPDEAIFILLSQVLFAMTNANVAESRLIFEWKFLIISGYAAGDTDSLYDYLQKIWKTASFSLHQQSVADEISSFISVSEQLSWIKNIHLSKTARSVLRKVTTDAFSAHLDMKLKSRKILDEATIHFYS